jgi:filamentous hemagglutinin family protein
MRDRLFINTALAASIALGMGSTAVMAATVSQLPGQGRIVAGQASVGNLVAGSMSLNVNGPTVINWGKGGDINAAGPAGFNIGSGAHVNFNGSTTSAAVLNIDSSGQPSQIFGALTAHGANVFVANGNGIIVGAKAQISSDRMVGLIANRLLPGAAAGFDGRSGSIAYGSDGGDVTVLPGASFGGGGKVLVAGGGNVNVDLGAFTGALALRAGIASNSAGTDAGSNPNATLTVAGQQRGTVTGFDSAGAATNLGTLSLAHAQVAGKFTNAGTLNLANGFSITGKLANKQTLNVNGDITVGRLTNKGNLITRGALQVRGAMLNEGSISSPTDAGGVQVTDGTFTNTGKIKGVSFVDVTRGDLVNDGVIRLVDRNDTFGTVGTVSVRGGNLLNRGLIASAVDANHIARYGDLAVAVDNGSIKNASAGRIADVGEISTGSDPSAPGFQDGADYSIVNAGSIAGNVSIDANFTARPQDNDSTGSFTNTGVLNLPAAAPGADRSLWIQAQDNIELGGKVTMGDKPLNATNALTGMLLAANNGTLTVATPLAFYADGQDSGLAFLSGNKVRITADVVGRGDDAAIYVTARRKNDGSYDFSVDPGVAFTASRVQVGGQ